MACKCEVLRIGNIRGVRVCKECVDKGKSLSMELKLLMADELKENVKEINQKVAALRQMFGQDIIN